MCYKYKDFKDDYSDDEDYLGMEDELAFAHTLAEAYNGNVEYMRVLGDIYSSHGHGVKADYKKAAYWYKKAADCGDNNSLVKLADLYYGFDRFGFPHDYERAFELYELATEAGKIKAVARLGIMYLYGRGCEKDVEKAHKLITAAAKEGEREACYEYAHILQDKGGKEWIDYLIKSAQSGYGKAGWEIIKSFGDELTDLQFIRYISCATYDYSPGYCPGEALILLGDCLMQGKHMKKDVKRAKNYYRDAAECYLGETCADKDYAKAVEALKKLLQITEEESTEYGLTSESIGDCYFKGGYGLMRDLGEAAIWYDIAAGCGVKTACKKLGDLYFNGEGVEQSYLKAEELYRKAAFYYEVWCDGGYDGEGFDLSANVALGDMYLNGTGVEKDLQRAFEFYYNAGYGKFYAPAQSAMANCYYNGLGVKKDIQKAEYWWKEAAQKGDAEACFALGLRFYEGDGVSQDSGEAYRYFSEADKAGNALATYYMGLCNYYGQGVQVSDDKAHGLFERAAECGCEEAKQALATLPFREHDLIVKTKEGDPRACELLTRYYHFRGNDKELDDMRAYTLEAEWLEEGVSHGAPQAMIQLAWLYLYGWGVKQDENKSEGYYKQAYESAKSAVEKDGNNAYALFWLGKCLANGYGCEKDENRGVELIAKAADLGNEKALLTMTSEYDKEGDGARIRAILEKLGEEGDPEIKRQVAIHYSQLKSCHDEERAAYWQERAAQAGNVYAQARLAEGNREEGNKAEWKARRGEDKEKNIALAKEKYKKSMYWYERLAEGGFLLANYDVAAFYYYNDYYNGLAAVGKDYKKAYGLLKSVAKCTHGNFRHSWKGAAAARILGDMYLKGLGVERDEQKSFNWYLSAARRESMPACTAVGNAYFYGIGTEVNYDLAVRWFENAVFDYDEQMYYGSEKGYDYGANVGLGDCYRLGLGVKKDEDEAFRLYDDVSKYTSDCPAADERVARCYYFGIGVARDEEKAKNFWSLAAENGDEDAKKALKEYFPEG